MSVLTRAVQNERLGYVAGLMGVAAVTAVCMMLRARINNQTVSLAMLLVVLFVAAVWGSWPAYLASVVGALSFGFFFVAPPFELSITEPRDWIALAAFLTTAFTVGHLSARTRRREAALLESEANLKAAQRIARVGSWHLDVVRNRLTWSDEVSRMFDMPGSAVLTYDTFLAQVHPEDRAAVQTAWSAALHGAPYDIEHRIIVDGTLKWVREIAQVGFDEHGVAFEATGTVQDITGPKEAENEVRRVARLQAVVAEVGERALRHPSLSEVADDVNAQVSRALDVEFCKILELLPNREALRLLSGVGWKPGYVGHATVGLGEESQAGYTLKVGDPVVVEDLITEKRFSGTVLLREHDIVSGVTVVIPTKHGPFGVLGAHTTRRRIFTRNEIDFLQSVANVLGSAIERQRAEAELWRIHRAQRALSKCNEALVRATSEPTLLQQVCDIIVEEAGYRFSWVGRADHDAAKSVRAVARAGFEAGYLDSLGTTWADTERGRGPTGTCIRTGRTVVARDIATDPRMRPWREEALKRGYGSSVAIPLLIDSEVFGALMIYAAEPDTFGAEEVELLSELASDLSFGITTLRTREDRDSAEEEIRKLNADLERRVVRRTAELQEANREIEQAREREFEVGFKIQQTLLLDRPPTEIHGLQVAALTVPSQRIDGDFYIFVVHQDQSLDVIVGDVMGKGIPAALLGAATKSQFLKALNSLLDLSWGREAPAPSEIVMRAHEELVHDLIDLESFVTLAYVRLDGSRRSLQLVDCGHTGLLRVVGGTGVCEMVRGNNLPMGVLEGEIYRERSVSIHAGDLLLLFSDGITDARNAAREAFGLDRLKACVLRHRRAEPATMVEAIRAAVVDFSRSERPGDDLTAVAIRVLEHEVPTTRARNEIRSELIELYRARAFVRQFCLELPGHPMNEEHVRSLELAVNEVASNIMKHAYHGRTEHPIELEAEAFPGRILIRLHHAGESFNPSGGPLPEPDLQRGSGFGLHLIARSIDGVRYCHDDRGRSCIELTKVYGEQGEGESR